MASTTSPSDRSHDSSLSRLRIDPPDLPGGPPYTLERGQPTPRRPSLLRPPIAVTKGVGILTNFPSTTAFALALGADSPCADYRCAGTLGLSAGVSLTLLSLLMSAFSLPIPPASLTTDLHRLTERSATARM